MKQEVLEEAGVDLSAYSFDVTALPDHPTAVSQKTLADTGEVVMVDMRFHDFVVHISLPSLHTSRRRQAVITSTSPNGYP